MRLLNTTTKRLKSFYGESIPKYAILSHMWGGEEDEVLFNHMAGSDDDRHEGERRKGYAKIWGACEQAINDGWKYIWIDTCCINKESSAELSEAINSMYAWYRKSQVCYVYLEDVQSDWGGRNSSAKDIRGDGTSPFKVVPFERSRWFSRGWTLQELIAPQYVVFYSRDWIDIGTKASLRDTISAVTRIRVDMLMAYNPKEASVAEKMSWAAFRETTRVEDIAYCLMGLFGVNMPLLYGEGNRAFRRLQEEVMKVSDDHSLFAWKVCFNDYRDVYKTRGMLADSPYNFRDGANVIRSDDGAYSPYSMTNQGLQIKLPLLPIDPKRDLVDVDSDFSKTVFKTILKCTFRKEGPTHRVVIYLKMVREGYYVRAFPHWLDETETNPNETHINEFPSLLVPQIDNSMAHYAPVKRDIKIKVLPTESGFTVDGCGLVGGREYSNTVYKDIRAIFFSRQGKRFAVVIGFDIYNNIPWLDAIDVAEGEQENEIRQSYKEGGSRCNVILRHLDRLSMKISNDWWVVVSVRKTGHCQNGSCFQAIIDIQRIPVLAKGWYIPSLFTNKSFSGDFPGNLNHHNLHPNLKKEHSDWFAMFNPNVKRILDVSLVHNFSYKRIISCIRFSRDGKYLATGCHDTVRIYDTETGAETCILIDESTKKRRLYVYSVCFSPDGKSLIAGGTDRQIRFWEIGEKRVFKVFEGHRHTIRSLWFSLDGRLIASGSKNGTVRIWEVANGTSKVLTTNDPNSLDNSAGVLSVVISPSSKRVAAGSSNGTICIWDTSTAQELQRFEGHRDNVYSIVFTPDEQGLVSGGADETLKCWNVGELISPGLNKKTGEVNDPGVSGMLTQRDTDRPSQRTISLTGHKLRLSVAISHDGRWVVSGSHDGCVQFWDLKSETVQSMLDGHITSICSVDMSPAGNTFATGSSDGRVRIWRYNTI